MKAASMTADHPPAQHRHLRPRHRARGRILPGQARAAAVTKQGSFGAEFLEGDTHISVHPAVHKDAKSLVGRHTGITLFVPDLLHYCGVLHDRGVRFTTEPTQQSWGIMAMVADPDGNVLALWEDKTPDEEEHVHAHQQPMDQADGTA